MKKLLPLLMLACFSSLNLVSQEVCESPEEDSFDMNSITKCTIKDSKNKKTRQITVKVSAARSRYLKKRKAKKKHIAGTLSALNASSVKSPNINNSASNIEKPLLLKKNIEKITSNLSIEELKKASKFSTVDNIPLFSNCEGSKKSERMDCFNTEMIKHIQKHFRYPSDAVRERIQGDVWVRFVIDKNGTIKNIKALGPKNASILNNEAKRVVSELPQFIPAKKNGEYVSVKYGFPISFSLEE
ncbi:energy transducer TonB [Tenacibaculum maritimum]|uniref:energy transducer TonB n=1 Tax=Tenacibaculum maritimum TaxID=107401 RepID=UPI0010A4C0D4|nr:energy transducer TonB [Tenacibaculum maritimum]QCD63685.1 hypothetical protein B9C57_14630 [Tenacibaculum maritimum]